MTLLCIDFISISYCYVKAPLLLQLQCFLLFNDPFMNKIYCTFLRAANYCNRHIGLLVFVIVFHLTRKLLVFLDYSLTIKFFGK